MPDLAALADLWPDALSPDERAVVRAAAKADPQVAADLRALAAAEASVRAAVDAAAGADRHLLVLHALAVGGLGDRLDAADLDRLARARPALDRLVEAVPALSLVLVRIADDARAFDAAWADALADGAPSAASAPPAPAVRADRASRPPQRRVARVLWRTVALSALLVGVVVSGLLVQRDAAMATADGAAVLALAGGTTIRTAAGARLEYPDPTRTSILRRPVRLRGDAFFEVAHTGETFTVETPTASVRVVGTVFGVRSDAARTEVTLVEGVVDVVGRAGGAVRLAPGQQTTVGAGAAPATPSPVDVPAALGWSGLDVFRDTPLDVALARLAARSGTALRADTRLAGQRVTGTFDASRPIEEILAALAVPLGATVERTAAGYTLR